jgi:hypothetical protein
MNIIKSIKSLKNLKTRGYCVIQNPKPKFKGIEFDYNKKFGTNTNTTESTTSPTISSDADRCRNEPKCSLAPGLLLGAAIVSVVGCGVLFM